MVLLQPMMVGPVVCCGCGPLDETVILLDEIVGSATFIDLTDDETPDVVIGGRESSARHRWEDGRRRMAVLSHTEVDA